MGYIVLLCVPHLSIWRHLQTSSWFAAYPLTFLCRRLWVYGKLFIVKWSVSVMNSLQVITDVQMHGLVQPHTWKCSLTFNCCNTINMSFDRTLATLLLQSSRHSGCWWHGSWLAPIHLKQSRQCRPCLKPKSSIGRLLSWWSFQLSLSCFHIFKVSHAARLKIR